MARTYLGHTLPEGLAEKAPATGTALLVVDMQNDFVHNDGYVARALGRELVTGFQAVVPAIRDLIGVARGAGVPVLYTKVTQLPDGSLASPVWLSDNLRYGIEPLHCMRGTWGWEILDELAPRNGDVVVEKPRRSAFQGTQLENALRARNVRTIVATGVAGSGCVESSVRDAIERDYFVVVPRDCVADNTAEMTDACLAAYQKLLAPDDLCTSAEVAQMWSTALRRSTTDTRASAGLPPSSAAHR